MRPLPFLQDGTQKKQKDKALRFWHAYEKLVRFELEITTGSHQRDWELFMKRSKFTDVQIDFTESLSLLRQNSIH